jgi:hypothetical protein
MSFLTILQECNLDFDRAKEIFYSLTDLQIAWLNMASIKRQEERDKEARVNSKFGEETKSFDLRER